MKPLAQNSLIQNRYLVVHPIGKGGMGEVYLAVDQRLGSAVALKRTFFSEDESLGNAFEREARILGRLRHPVLPKVIDHFVENNDQFLVMEHISGDDLAKRLESANKPFPLSWVMFWADQMLDALNYLHSHEPPIVHRDIKPQNLKLTDENHIVLLDFGLSKDFDSNSKNALNSASVAGYSPHFASMEQIRGTGTDARSDLYSLSATLYQFMANQSPVDALSRADALLGGKADPVQPLNELNPEVSPEISAVILKGIALRQDERFATAAEMQKALRRAFNKTGDDSTGAPKQAPVVADVTVRLDAPPVTSAPMPASSYATRIPSGSPEVAAEPTPPPSTVGPEVKVAAAAAGTASVPDYAVAATRLETIPPAPKPVAAAAQPKNKSKAGMFIGLAVGLLLIGGVAAAGGWYMYKQSAAVAPTPTPTLAPTVAPTPEQAVVAETPDTSNADTIAEPPTEEPAATSATVQPDSPSSTRSTPTVATKSTPGKTDVKAPAAKTTPPPKAKAKDERTLIDQ